MKNIKIIIVLLVCLMVQGAWAETQKWTSGNTTCTLTDDGTFTVSPVPGTDGAMANYVMNSERPWNHEGFNTITKVVVESGVTVLGTKVFESFEKVTDVTLSPGLKEIRRHAFNYCDLLTSITIPFTVTHIDAEAFRYCDKLNDIYCYAYPENLTWGLSADDFKTDSRYPGVKVYYTWMHVRESDRAAYIAKFGTAENGRLNVRFADGIATTGNWTDYRAAAFSHVDGDITYIENEAELALLAYKVNNGMEYENKTFAITRDLDLSEHYWVPIGTEEHSFGGALDGRFHTVNGLLVNRPSEDYNGLVGYLRGYLAAGPAFNTAKVYDLVLKRSSITGRNHTGGVVGRMHGRTEMNHVFCYATVKGATHVGGLVGSTEGLVIHYNEFMTEYNPVEIHNNLYLGNSITGNGNKAALIGTIDTKKDHVDYYNNFYTDKVFDRMNSYDVYGYALNVQPANLGKAGEEYSIVQDYANGIKYDGKYYVAAIGLWNDASNEELVRDITENYSGGYINMQLTGRTLHRDGSWNTLCLPFATPFLFFTTDDFKNASIMEMTAPEDNSHKTGYDPSDGTLYLYFKPIYSPSMEIGRKDMQSGTPYLVKWPSGGTDLVNPTFKLVLVPTSPVPSDKALTITSSNSGLSPVDFVGTYGPAKLEKGEQSSFFFGTDNTISYPNANYTVDALSGYFNVPGETVRAVVMDFGDEGTSSNTLFLSDYANNDAVLNTFKGKVANVVFTDRSQLSAVNNGNGTWTPKAYTICLPFDLSLNEQVSSPDDVQVYTLDYIHNPEAQFCFRQRSSYVPAGDPALVVVNTGKVNLNVKDVTISNTLTPYNVYRWKGTATESALGSFAGTFSLIDNDSGAEQHLYGLSSANKSYLRVRNDEERYRSGRIPAFRAFFTPKDVLPLNGYYVKGLELWPGGSEEEDKIIDFPNVEFEDDCDFGYQMTAIHSTPNNQSSIVNGQSTYDLQGRKINGQLPKGIYIHNGKKIIIK